MDRNLGHAQALGQANRVPLQIRVLLVLNGGQRSAAGRGRETVRLISKVSLPIQTPTHFRHPMSSLELSRRQDSTACAGAASAAASRSSWCSGALMVLTVMLTEFQDETAADFGSALSERDGVKAEYAARSAVNLSRLLIAAEPTIRKSLAVFFLMMRQGPPQIPVWEFADQALGAFNDKVGNEAFATLAGINMAEGKNLGLEGAGFEVEIVDEDSKINLNQPARGDAFSQIRLGAQVMGLIMHPQYDPLFEHRDADGQFSDRQAICSAIVDWVDPDQDSFNCDPAAGAAQQSGAEDSYYERLKRPYSRKNAAFDSIEELRLVRGMGDDFWATFVDPDPDKPDKRVVTVWGQGQINVNTANAQTLLAFICSPNVAPEQQDLRQSDRKREVSSPR